MTRKTPKPYRMAPLQKLKVREIKDPAEQAALDERLKRSDKASARGHMGESSPGKGMPLAVLELCRHLSAEERLLIANGLTEQLSLDQRMDLLELLRTQLPPEALRQFEERFYGHQESIGNPQNKEAGTMQE
jgi:hypothetical protein